MVLKESDFAKYKEIFSASAGGAYTPAAGTEIFGWGSSKQGRNTLIDARRLNLHPVASESADHSRDLTFWKAYAKPDSIVFSGENPQTLSITFACYLDSNKDSRVSFFCFGDHTQVIP